MTTKARPYNTAAYRTVHTEALRSARVALLTAERELFEARPRAIDFLPDAYRDAVAEHDERMTKVRLVIADLTDLIGAP